MNIEFDYHAMQALNYWVKPNRGFYSKLNSEDRKLVLEGIADVLTTYKVARNFKRTEINGKRYSYLLNLVTKYKKNLRSGKIVTSVESLAADIKIKYGQYAISAASKVLWFYSRDKVVIYDELARLALVNLSGVKLKKSDYSKFFDVWHTEYKKFNADIRASSQKLVSVSRFSLARELSERDLERIVKSNWFHNRVFDYYLWYIGGDLQRKK